MADAARAAAQAAAHYNSSTTAGHVRQTMGQAQERRLKSKTAQLKKFHNEIKKKMVFVLARQVPALLDLACGRGGDIWKWIDADVQSVLGVDISEHEVAECRRRLDLISQKKQIPGEYKFLCSDGIGQRPMEWDRKFQACTCQFAAHYFFASRETLRCFLTNVATALDEGGHFFGTIPDGKQILNVLRGQDLYDSGLLRVRRTWKGPFNSFGSFGAGYTFAIANTVTNVDKDSDDLGDGCEEYLVFFNAFTEMAAELGLFPPNGLNWQREFGQLFEPRPPQSSQGKPYDAFRLFNPQYDQANPDSQELEKISRVYAGFVFRKDSSRIRNVQQQGGGGGGGGGGKPQESREQQEGVRGKKRRAEEQDGRGAEADKKRHLASRAPDVAAARGDSASAMPPSRLQPVSLIALEPFSDAHRASVFAIVNQPNVAKWMGQGHGWNESKVDKLIRYCKADAAKPPSEVNHWYWAVMAPSSGGAVKVVGLVAVHYVPYERPRPGQKQKFFFSIFIDGAAQGRGIGKKATKECLAEFKTKRPDVPDVYADVHAGNAGSTALMLKTGFVAIGKTTVGTKELDRYIYDYTHS